MAKVKDLIGNKYGRLVVVSRAENKGSKTAWLCKCDCGNEVIVTGNALQCGDTCSCGCFRRDKSQEKMSKHNMSDTRLYRIWKGIKSRCYIKSSSSYIHYGGRGIIMCDDWKNDFINFYNWSIKNGYREDLTIERKDVNGNYCEDNCVWITEKEQHNNTRNSRLIEIDGELKTAKQWSEYADITYDAIICRLKRGISGQDLLKKGGR